MRFKKQEFIISLALVALVALAFTSCGCTDPPKGHLVTETYIVATGDTLDNISYKFIAKSNVKRDVREFREGIIEQNWELLKNRQPGMIYPGDRLQISYWVSE